MATLTFDDLITKTSYVFKKDAYLVNNRYAIGGTNSEIENVSEFLCVYNTDFMNVLKDKFEDKKVVSILDLKKVKKEPKLLITDINEELETEVIERKNKLEKLILSIDNWKSFDFNEDDAETLFGKYNSLELFTDNDKIPSVTITKSLFPLIKPANAENLYYKVIIPEDNEELIQLVISYDTEWFQIYNLVHYITIK